MPDDTPTRPTDEARILDGILADLGGARRPDTADTWPNPVVGEPVARPAMLGRFQVVREIAQGGMGVLYEAYDPTLARKVALKVLRDDRRVPTARERFLQEAQLAARLKHPNILPVFEVGQVSGDPYIAMELVEGETYADLLERGGPLDPLIAHLELVARAIGYAHQHKVAHRDLKPGNILIDGAGRPLVADFGIARALDADRPLTLAGECVGTPGYMAPEQLEGKPDRLGTSCDIWALGVMLYEVLARVPPFRGTTPLEVCYQVLHREPSPIAGVPRDLAAIAFRAMDKSPSRRYATAEEFADELARFRRGEAVRARPVGRTGLLMRWARRNRALSLAIVVALLAIPSAPIVYVVQARTHAADLTRQDRVQRVLGEADTVLRDWRAQFQAPVHDMSGPFYAIARARASVMQLVSEEPGLAEGWSLLGDLCLAQADTRAAGEAYQRALDAGTPSVPGTLRLGMAAVFEWRFACVREGVLNTLAEEPYDPTPPGAREPFDRAIACFRRALAGAPPEGADDAMPPFEYGHARALVALADGRDEDAREALLAASREAGWLAGFVLVDARPFYADPETARERLEEASRYAASLWLVRIGLAQTDLEISLQAGVNADLAAAITSARAAVASAELAEAVLPRHRVVLSALAAARLRLGIALGRNEEDPGPVLDEAESAVEAALGPVAHGGGEDVLGHLWLTRAAIHVARGRRARTIGGEPRPHFERALSALDRCVALLPGRKEVFAIRSFVNLRLGNLRDALADARRAREGGSPGPLIEKLLDREGK